jgi:hypothetical protein
MLHAKEPSGFDFVRLAMSTLPTRPPGTGARLPNWIPDALLVPPK